MDVRSFFGVQSITGPRHLTTIGNSAHLPFSTSPRAMFWVASKNDPTTPSDVNRNNQSRKFWFRCQECNHEFDALLNSVNNGSWCPFCAHKRLCDDNRCNACFANSFASNPKSAHLCDTEPPPRTLFRSANKKYRFLCERGHPFEMILNNVDAGKWCKMCGFILSSEKQRKSLELLIEQFRAIHGDYYGYQLVDYTGDAVRVTIICPEHGAFEQTPGGHLSGGGCILCGIRKAAMSRKLTQEECIERFSGVHAGRYGYGEVVYRGQDTPVTIICTIHGGFEQLPYIHWAGSGCRACGVADMANAQRMTNEEFIERAKKVHLDKYSYPDTNYVRGHDKVIIHCKKHGPFEQDPFSHLSGFGCAMCTPVGFSKNAIEWLEFMSGYCGINIRHAGNGGEIVVPGSRYRADGYSDGCVWEFDGDYYHGNPRIYARDDVFPHSKTGVTFGDNLVRTVRKRVILRSIGFRVIHVWESEWKRAKNLVISLQRAFRAKHC